MLLILLILLFVLFFGLGFTVKWLFILALVFLILALYQGVYRL